MKTPEWVKDLRVAIVESVMNYVETHPNAPREMDAGDAIVLALVQATTLAVCKLPGTVEDNIDFFFRNVALTLEGQGIKVNFETFNQGVVH